MTLCKVVKPFTITNLNLNFYYLERTIFCWSYFHEKLSYQKTHSQEKQFAILTYSNVGFFQLKNSTGYCKDSSALSITPNISFYYKRSSLKKWIEFRFPQACWYSWMQQLWYIKRFISLNCLTPDQLRKHNALKKMD